MPDFSGDVFRGEWKTWRHLFVFLKSGQENKQPRLLNLQNKVTYFEHSLEDEQKPSSPHFKTKQRKKIRMCARLFTIHQKFPFKLKAGGKCDDDDDFLVPHLHQLHQFLLIGVEICSKQKNIVMLFSRPQLP